MALYIYNGECAPELKQMFIDLYKKPGPKATTVFYLSDGTIEEYDIVGAINHQWMVDHGYWIENGRDSHWGKYVLSAEIGTHVTAIGASAFSSGISQCSIYHITIPNSVTSIASGAFINSELNNNYESNRAMIFYGRTLSEVQAMSNYPWGIDDPSFISVA